VLDYCQLFPQKINSVNLYKQRQWLTQKHTKNESKFFYFTFFVSVVSRLPEFCCISVTFSGINASSRFWFVSAHNQSLPLDPVPVGVGVGGEGVIAEPRLHQG
jgi:hypothetical protein